MPGFLDLLGVAKTLIETGQLDLQASNGFANPYNGFTNNSFLGNLIWNSTNSTILGEIAVRHDEDVELGIPNDWSTDGPFNFDNEYGGPGWEGIYDIDYMKDFIGIQMEGAGDEMNNLMEQLQFHLNGDNPDLDIEDVIGQIAELRGEDFDDMMAMYEKTQELFTMQTVQDYFDPINQDLHPDFLGSNESLKYGKVVGDSIGLDAVFAALLNPSGGIVGPGNIGSDMANEPIGYHGIFHDAGGWMWQALDNFGPGYNYVEDVEGAGAWPEIFTKEDGKLAGQLSGTTMWNNLMHPEGNLISNGIRTAGDFGDAILGIIGDGLESGGSWLNDNIPVVGPALDALTGIANTALHETADVLNEISEVQADLMDGDLLGAAGNALEAIYQTAEGALNIAVDVVEETVEAVVDIAEDVVSIVGDVASVIGNGIGNAVSAIGNFFSGLGF